MSIDNSEYIKPIERSLIAQYADNIGYYPVIGTLVGIGRTVSSATIGTFAEMGMLFCQMAQKIKPSQQWTQRHNNCEYIKNRSKGEFIRGLIEISPISTAVGIGRMVGSVVVGAFAEIGNQFCSMAQKVKPSQDWSQRQKSCESLKKLSKDELLHGCLEIFMPGSVVLDCRNDLFEFYGNQVTAFVASGRYVYQTPGSLCYSRDPYEISSNKVIVKKIGNSSYK